MPISYRKAFWKSRHHLWLGILTLGLGFLSAEPLGLLVGATLYAIGLVFLPDSAFFRRSVDDRIKAEQDKLLAQQWAEFKAQQEKLLASLSPARRARYSGLLSVCREIESASTEAQKTTGLDLEPRLRKLDELIWTFLRMLSVEQTLEVYLEAERKEHVPQLVASLEAEAQSLAAEVAVLKKSNREAPALATRERLLTSRLERLEGLKTRVSRIEQAQANHDLIRSEQERLVEQVKLIRADAVASKNADALSARIDLSIEHLATTNQWLSQLTEFKEVTLQMPEMPANERIRPASPLRTQPQSHLQS